MEMANASGLSVLPADVHIPGLTISDAGRALSLSKQILSYGSR